MATQREVIVVDICIPKTVTRTVKNFEETHSCSRSEDSLKVNVLNLLENLILIGLWTLGKWEVQTH